MPAGIGGRTEHMNVPGRHLQTNSMHNRRKKIVDVKEVAGQQSVRLIAQEGAPGGVPARELAGKPRRIRRTVAALVECPSRRRDRQ